MGFIRLESGDQYIFGIEGLFNTEDSVVNRLIHNFADQLGVDN